MIGKLFCWFGWCTLGDAYEHSNEHSELPPVLLARCIYCDSLHRLT